jgi:hypothetical protein
MTLTFPNLSRSYDAGGRRVRFWGHDQSIEVPFFLEEAALFKLFPRTPNAEEGILSAFDAARDRIFQVATKLYAPKLRAFYVLEASHF